MLFLDEPSAGLDPQARLEIHELVQDLRREQRTILLTTHYIEEAEKLCDRVAIVDEGRIVAIGTPREIQERTLANSTIEIELRRAARRDRAARVAATREKVTLDERRTRIAVTTAQPGAHHRRDGQVAGRTGHRAGRYPHQAALAGRRLHRTDRKESARMRAYLALFKNNMRLTLRDRSVLFFNYLFPLIFFFAFAELFHAGTGGGIAYFVSTVLTMGILGNGLWGAGMRSVQEREANILRRFKVTPISPLPILVAAMVSGWLLYLPVLVLLVGLAHFLYAMPLPQNWFSLFLMASLGVCALRAIGLILAAVTNTMQEATIAIQLLYMPMLFLSGATIPAAMLPNWAQTVAQFMPASYLVTGFQGIFFRNQNLLRQRAGRGRAACSPWCSAPFSPCSSSAGRRKRKSSRARSSGCWPCSRRSSCMGCYQAYSKEHIGAERGALPRPAALRHAS